MSEPLPAAPSLAPPDYDAFLRDHVLSQPLSIQRYDRGDETLWVKRAGASNPAWRYRALALLAACLRLPVLRPVPNPGGHEAIRTEVRRLRQLARRGLRVPAVLAECEDGFAMRHLGSPGVEAPSLGNAMEAVLPRGDGSTLALWLQGLQTLQQVHGSGDCLSQAFARNMVCCADGVIGFIDFEDDPAAHLPLPLCRVRDALCYAHSTAWILAKAGAMPAARSAWQDFVQAMEPETRALMERTTRQLAWVRHLPESRRLGRDMQRLRMAYTLVTP
ncbi:Predicted acyl-CoA transferases/carnitine dehydratase [Delftia tsuruhatensis]|uniref:hypothetical protein n=1 Tax=Delftia tsuruhatensis TaxID=180282 RepID=UPI001EF41026|nr:hypothetical protein [Delftia tsuruhatensis]CAB5720775.1 Predicted acyl-CoA transferases/carnitine dehydratase [Delftia tsuruhatensis]